jgi:hypothetical protein
LNVDLRLDILPKEQRSFWRRLAPELGVGFVLYGGTAIALRHGHRESRDFDFFSSRSDVILKVKARIAAIRGARFLTSEPDSVTALVPVAKAQIKASFFGSLRIGRVGTPERTASGLLIASPLDLMATKLKALHDRVEPKDYIDIDCLIRSGVTLSDGTAAAVALFPELSDLWTVKTLAWFGAPGLRGQLPAEMRRRLARAATNWKRRAQPISRLAGDLGEAAVG